MKTLSRLGALAAMLFLVPALGAQNPFAKGVPTTPGEKMSVDAAKVAEARFKAKIMASPWFAAKLTAINVEGDEKRFTVEVPFQHRTLNAEKAKVYQEIVGRYQDAFRRNDQNAVKQLYAEAYEAYIASFDVEDAPITYELKADKTFEVRKSALPPKEPGDDGRIRPYSAKELTELKGNARLPGYAATLKELDTDIMVAVYLDKAKMRPAPRPLAKAKDKEPEPAPEADPALPVLTLVILPPRDMVPGAAPGAGGNPFAANPFAK